LEDENIKFKNSSTIQTKKALGFRLWALGPEWSFAWKLSSFRWKFWAGMIVLAGILIAFPYFFDAIENRSGYSMSDFVLQWIPPYNVSVAVFFLIWSSCLLLLIRIYRDPMMLLVALWAYNGVTLVRMASIGLISLNPPVGLLPLADPITNLFYGAHYITHDLFFSGHTTTVFLIFLCLKRKQDRIYVLSASILLGVLLLVQHVHYTVDVLAAPVFTYVFYWLALLFTKPENQLYMLKHNQV
jgi:hypothetical protein